VSVRDLQEHLAAGPTTDLEGNCKLCGKLIETPGVHLMHDPDTERAGPPIDFCSAECLYKAEHIFDGLPVAVKLKIRNAIDAIEKARS